MKRISLPTSAKKDLTSVEINLITKNLFRNNNIFFFYNLFFISKV
jgi:hypothetical protein